MVWTGLSIGALLTVLVIGRSERKFRAVTAPRDLHGPDDHARIVELLRD